MDWRGLWAALALACAAPAAGEPIKVYGNTSTIELAPVLLAAQRAGADRAVVANGGVPNLFRPGEADLATNAETQALRVSVDHPDLRIILTVSEGLYRMVARRSAGIASVKDLKGKRIATFPSTSSAYFLHKLLAREGISDADVTVVPILPLEKMTAALKAHEVDAVVIWEPEIQRSIDALGADGIAFSGKGLYRELFNLHARAADLADPARRARIVAFVRATIRASADLGRQPKLAWPLIEAAARYDEPTIARSWPHEAYPGALVPDLLDVLVEEDVWVAKEKGRPPRSREGLSRLIDASVLKEALAGR